MCFYANMIKGQHHFEGQGQGYLISISIDKKINLRC